MSNSHNGVNRSFADRVRHTILFEVGMLAIATPIGMLLFDADAKTIGATALALSLIAMGWNALFNYWFDNWMLAKVGHIQKSATQRIVHALLFELGLLVLTIPVLAWALTMTLLEALIADIGFVVFALVYAYLYNLFYDKVFPVKPA
ncbi:PACE efflux transporter [Paraferrimonas haliotis]|uniref:Transporter n=1 Tax=Paraferrimonas haliotis TaxID=2013866 RepID=A0AA37WY03_9GAMM|nr:PACE efflux transporter [Paraferrimonas haliotis]GLS84124.1 transporter [Paraferrimonas haliotis]